MKLDNVFELYQLICKGTENIPAQKQARMLRKAYLESMVAGQGFQKLAFDTRRIDQETEYNPRRGLQNYNRSEAFITEAVSLKLGNLSKLQGVLEGLRGEFGREREWQDSNARVLLSTLDNGLRTNIKDGDYATSQPAQGSIDYIEELLHVRYRLDFDKIARMAAPELRTIILSKDEDLTRRDVGKHAEITKSDVTNQSYDSLMDKLFGNIRATKDNPEVERTVTITIKDKFVETK